jgi:iron complex outermembrane receptor protein
VTGNEGFRDINPAGGTATPAQCRTPNVAGQTCTTGYLGGTPFFGRDVNGDGDTLDTVTVVAPSQTQTHRYTAITGIRYDINDDHSIRIAYTFDRARHRQTGEVGLVDFQGTPFDVFPVNDPLSDVSGSILQKRIACPTRSCTRSPASIAATS